MHTRTCGRLHVSFDSRCHERSVSRLNDGSELRPWQLTTRNYVNPTCRPTSDMPSGPSSPSASERQAYRSVSSGPLRISISRWSWETKGARLECQAAGPSHVSPPTTPGPTGNFHAAAARHKTYGSLAAPKGPEPATARANAVQSAPRYATR